VLLEAWANGIPCIGYRAGGIAEVIRHDSDGLLVPCGDIDGLVQAFKHVLQDDDRRLALGKQGRLKIATEHRWNDKLDIVRRVYQSVT
jgi:glycosyltransferase involved in cell wall biosynthesis